jgi:hypothetical protein
MHSNKLRSWLLHLLELVLERVVEDDVALLPEDARRHLHLPADDNYISPSSEA